MEGEFELIIPSLKELTHQHLEFTWADQQNVGTEVVVVVEAVEAAEEEVVADMVTDALIPDHALDQDHLTIVNWKAGMSTQKITSRWSVMGV